MAIDKRAGVSEQVSFLSGIAVSDTNNNVLLIGHRNQLQNGEYNVLKPSINYPLVSPYKVYQIPNFANTNSYINYMKSLGFQVTEGISNTLLYSQPTSVNSSIINGETIVTLTWSTVPPDTWSYLQGNGLTITATQGTITIATGTVVNVSTDGSYTMTLKNVTNTFSTVGGNVTFTANNLNVPVLNGNSTDEIVMMVNAQALAQFSTTIKRCATKCRF